MHDQSRRGKWDPELFATYRASEPGPHRRAILDRLLFENEPLLKTLTDQLCGHGAPKRNDLKLPGSTLSGLKDLDWDDAMQAARMAFLKAMDQFNPEKGKLSGYLKWKILYELQCLVQRDGLTYVPRGREAETISVELVGDQTVLDTLSNGHDEHLVTSSEFGRDDVERWRAQKWWPETIEDAKDEIAEYQSRQLRRNAAAWAKASLQRIFEFRPAARIAVARAYNDYRLDCRRHSAREIDRPTLVNLLCGRAGVRLGWIRTTRGGSEPALAGVRGTAALGTASVTQSARISGT